MFSKLFSRRGSPATPRTSLETGPHAAAATQAWIKSNNPVEQEEAQKSIFEQILIAESEQKMLKKRGEVAKVIRRQKGQLFQAERGSHDSGYATMKSSMSDEEAKQRYNKAVVWADDLQSDPLYLEDDVRKSLTPPDWAVSTALDAMQGKYQPTMFDWLDTQTTVGGFVSPPRLKLKDYEEGDFAGWCESLMNSVFGLTGKENNDELLGRLSTPLEDDEERMDFFVPLEADEEEMEQVEEQDDGPAYRVGTIMSGHRGITFHQAPLVAESIAVIRHVSGGVVPHQQAQVCFC